VFDADLDEADVAFLLDRFCSKAQRSGLKPFVTLASTIRKRRAGILAAVRLGINNARHEGLNRRVRLIINRAQGYPSEPTGFVDGACRHGRAARGRSRLGGRPRRPGGVGRFFFGAG